MMSQTKVMLLSALIALSTLSLNVFAHQQKSGLTTVLFNPNTNNIEVMHRVYMHDAEHAVKTLFDKSADIINSEATQQQFAQYVAQRFAIYDEMSQAFALDLIGFEVDGRHFWIYQETAQPANIGKLTVRHDVLRDIHTLLQLSQHHQGFTFIPELAKRQGILNNTGLTTLPSDGNAYREIALVWRNTSQRADLFNSIASILIPLMPVPNI